MLSGLLCAGCASGGRTVPQSPVPAPVVAATASDHPAAAPVEPDADAWPVGHVRLGVHCVKVTPQLARAAHLPVGAGVRVVTIEAQSLAQESGLRIGDVIVRYGDRAVSEVSDLSAAIAATARGAEVAITVVRGTGEKIVVVQF